MSTVEKLMLPDQPVLSILEWVPLSELQAFSRMSVERLEALAEQERLVVTGTPFAIFHGEVTPESNGPLEICLPVSALVRFADGIRSFRLAGGHAVGVRVKAGETEFPQIVDAYDAGCQWVMENGHNLIGPPREIWTVPAWADEPTEITVVWPYA